MNTGSLRQDFRFAVRGLLKKPGFTLVIVSILALGIGINSVVFSLVNAILLRPIAADEPSQLVRVYTVQPDGSNSFSMSYPNFSDYQERNQAFSDMAAVNITPLQLGAGAGDEQILGEIVTTNYFALLGIAPNPGRSFLSRESGPVAVVSRKFLSRHFRSATEITGKSIKLNDIDFQVIGIAPEQFTGTFAGARVDVWVSVEQGGMWLGNTWKTERQEPLFQVIGRLKEGVKIAEAQASLDPISTELERLYPASNKNKRVALVPATLLHGNLRKGAVGFLSVVTLLVVLVLLIACANIANLLLARGIGRAREIAIRLSLGARQYRIIQQLMLESVLLALLGGVTGLLLATWAGGLLMQWNPLPFVPLHFDLGPDWRVFAATFSASLLTGVIMGIIPALKISRQQPSEVLKDQRAASGDIPTSRLRDMFIVAQVAVCLILLVSLGLFLQSLRNSMKTNPGFSVQNVLAIDIDVSANGFSEEKGRFFYDTLLDRLDRMPDVESAALSERAPVDISTPKIWVAIPGAQETGDQSGILLSATRVTAGVFETLGIQILRGRNFQRSDDPQAPQVAIVNQTLASKYWTGQDALGKRIEIKNDDGTSKVVEVIGVAQDSKYRTLGEEPTPHIYLPFWQNYKSGAALLARTRGNPAAMIQPLQRELRLIEPDVRGFFARTLKEHLRFALLPAQVIALLTSIFGALALALVLIGIYAAVSYLVYQRTREIGIRMALGANARVILQMVLARGLRLSSIGIVIGIVGALALGQVLSGLLLGISGTDVRTYIAISLSLIFMVLLACLLPARRALRIDAATALRYE